MKPLNSNVWIKIPEVEVEIVQLLANGLRVAQIASKRGRSPNTISSQIHHMLKKFDCLSMAHLVAEFLRQNIIE